MGEFTCGCNGLRLPLWGVGFSFGGGGGVADDAVDWDSGGYGKDIPHLWIDERVVVVVVTFGRIHNGATTVVVGVGTAIPSEIGTKA